MNRLLIFSLILFSISATAQRSPFKNLSEKDGKIGIGTSNPDELLTVKGKIHTQEVLVDLDGAVAPDYVFEKYFNGFSERMPDYTLISLEELEAFLKENNHLPNVPSAETMQNEGISLKEMNLILLQKIEELTLYTLQQQKEIDKLKKEIYKD
ncbi:tail fiber protein [Aequorivita sp. SDUM287046]|uniref:Tail fiber protein n=1 Tax=Aequorivita aurantiaca TaxID=3053356 RepID=A0ABT8DIF6_9FLAO|nr:tail fiber protein [Aequorivita aurantiaca]MDN3725171.1 tail fiber protein [Aequorivita aurantiaca]